MSQLAKKLIGKSTSTKCKKRGNKIKDREKENGDRALAHKEEYNRRKNDKKTIKLLIFCDSSLPDYNHISFLHHLSQHQLQAALKK